MQEGFKSELEITAWERMCWVCGRKGGYLTSHHTLPKHLKPVKNFLCPVCEKCHKDLNKDDVKGIIAFAYKIQRTFQDLQVMVENMTGRMKGNSDGKDRDKTI